MSTLSENRIQLDAALKTLFEGLLSGTGGSSTPIPVSRMNIINYVKAKLDELIPEAEGVSFNLSANPNVSNPYDLLINGHLPESVKDVSLSAPLSVLYPTLMGATTGTYEGTEKTGYIVLPVNFLRLSLFKMADWEREIIVPIIPSDPKYRKQSISFLRGGVTRPVAVLNWKSVPTTEGGVTTYNTRRILEYYSIKTSHSVEILHYIPELSPEDFVLVNPMLLDALAWTCASKIMQILGQTDAFKMAVEQVKLSYAGL